MKLFLLKMTLLLNVLSARAFSDEIKFCQLAEVTHPGYEELYKFSFEDYPKLTLIKNQAGQYSMQIGSLNYSEATDKYFEIKVYGNPNKYFVFYDGTLTETIEFTKNMYGKKGARLRAILDETNELYDIARFYCR